MDLLMSQEDGAASLYFCCARQEWEIAWDVGLLPVPDDFSADVLCVSNIPQEICVLLHTRNTER